jgi:hypothetical protein
MARLKQWVNLEKKEVFVERGIDSLDRLGPVFFNAKFKNPDSLPVSLRVSKVSEKAAYSEAEKNRNANFILLAPIGLDVNEGTEVALRCVAFLPPAGGAVYKVEAKAGDDVAAASDELESWRRLFFQVFHMTGVVVPDLTPTFDYYKTLFVELMDVPAGKTIDIPYLENAMTPDLIDRVKPHYTVADREPWVMALVYAHALPGLKQLQIGATAAAGSVSLPSSWSGNSTLALELTEGSYFWWKMNPVHDAMNGGQGIWRQSDATLTVDGKTHVIPKSAISIDTNQSVRPGAGFNRFKIALPEEVRNKNWFSGKDAKLKVSFFVVDGFAGGFAVLRHNLLAVARNFWWRDKDATDTERVQVLNHEFGHKLGMVAKGGRPLGSETELDAPDKLYGDIDEIYGTITPALKPKLNAKGHRGAHCERGVSATQSGGTWKWSGTPGCTMFGSMGTSTATTPPRFCEVCGKLVTRQDLDFVVNGLPGFTSLLTY